jgi:small subunit ribosomal protein S15
MSFNLQSKQQVVKDFQINSTDTGSVEVQVALLTTRIEQLTEHLRTNQKDFSSKRGLVKMVSQRKKLLNYLKNKDQERYQTLIGRLGLKK